MMAVIAGHDPRDSGSSTRPVPDYVALLDEPPEGGRIGRLRGWFERDVAPEVLAAHDAALDALAGMGFEVVDVEVPGVDLAVTAAWHVCYPEMLSLHEGHFPDIEQRDAMGAGLLATTPFVSALDYLRALRHRTAFQRALAEALDGCVALALPGADAPPPRLDELTTPESLKEWLGRTVSLHIPFNYTGVPALCLPSGSVEGMPTSLQLVGLPHTDATLLALGHRFQQETAFHLDGPPVLAAG